MMSSNQCPLSILKALAERRHQESLKELKLSFPGIDFCSNDYLGFSKDGLLKSKVDSSTEKNNSSFGATGSRLVSGNSNFIDETEKQIAMFHHAQSALIFNSGYIANLGLLSCVPQKNDLVLFDELAHASIFDGIKLGQATNYRFKHNDADSLEELILRHRKNYENIYIVVESVYSIDGETAPLIEIVELCKAYKNIFLIVDEAHALGVFGNQGRGLCNALAIEHHCFARVFAYGKAMGCFGAAIVCSETLRTFLINFSRPLIYTTALPKVNVEAILYSYRLLLETNQKELLQGNIAYFYSKTSKIENLVKSQSAIHSLRVGSNDQVDLLEKEFEQRNIYVRAVKSPAVKLGNERIRISIHSFNTREQIDLLVEVLLAYKKPDYTKTTYY